jgi:G3E family GTPase
MMDDGGDEVPMLVEDLPPVPLVLITGFLGAGKSTLVKHTMEELVKHKKRVALIQNEFAGVEQSPQPTVTDDSGNAITDFMDLANGCVCCTVKTDFVSAIQELLRRQHFDCILVECRGDADPSPIIELFWVDSELEFGVYLDSVVCVVDSLNFLNVFKTHAHDLHGVRFGLEI